VHRPAFPRPFPAQLFATLAGGAPDMQGCEVGRVLLSRTFALRARMQRGRLRSFPQRCTPALSAKGARRHPPPGLPRLGRAAGTPGSAPTTRSVARLLSVQRAGGGILWLGLPGLGRAAGHARERPHAKRCTPALSAKGGRGDPATRASEPRPGGWKRSEAPPSREAMHTCSQCKGPQKAPPARRLSARRRTRTDPHPRTNPARTNPARTTDPSTARTPANPRRHPAASRAPSGTRRGPSRPAQTSGPRPRPAGCPGRSPASTAP
jgi:hypothetical protein